VVNPKARAGFERRVGAGQSWQSSPLEKTTMARIGTRRSGLADTGL